MRINGRISLLIAAIITVFLDVHAPTALAAQAEKQKEPSPLLAVDRVFGMK